MRRILPLSLDRISDKVVRRGTGCDQARAQFFCISYISRFARWVRRALHKQSRRCPWRPDVFLGPIAAQARVHVARHVSTFFPFSVKDTES